ncbi:MAG: hypothetical protein Fur0032_18730 [Terrimicrobiaceae bacterium]
MKTIGRLSLVLVAGATSATASYQDVINFFVGEQSGTSFPVQGRGLADVESAFGPRIQTSGGNYDWHRGIDIDGTDGSDLVQAVLPGYLHRYSWESSSSGYTTILRHELSDFGVPSLTYGGRTITRFYTWYSHLSDDGVDNNGVGTGDLYMDAFADGDPIPQGTVIGILGSSGTPANGGSYGPHLHFELRVGTNASLQFQLANPDTTQWGFDPHINPMILFDPAVLAPGVSSNQTLQSLIPAAPGASLQIRYANSSDLLPLLNRVEVEVIHTQSNTTVKSHLLDFDQRVGYDASTTALLDTRDFAAPYIDPLAFGDTATQFQSDIRVPAAWLASYETPVHTLRVTATDLYGSAVQLDLALVPEPSLPGLVIFATAFLLVRLHIRKSRCWVRA